MIEYVNLRKIELGINPLYYVIVPGYSYDCWLLSTGVTLDNLKDEQILEEFLAAKRRDIYGIIGDRFVSTSKSNRSIWYIDSNNLYGYARKQKSSSKLLYLYTFIKSFR